MGEVRKVIDEDRFEGRKLQCAFKSGSNEVYLRSHSDYVIRQLKEVFDMELVELPTDINQEGWTRMGNIKLF